MAWIVLPLMCVGWTGICLWAAHRIGGWCAGRGVPGGAAPLTLWTLKALVLVVLLPLPMLDELVAQSQFKALCHDPLAVRVQPGAPARLGVRHSVSDPEPVQGVLVPVTRQAHHYADMATQQVRVSFFTFQAAGGKFARMAGLPDIPLTFNGFCGPRDPQALLAAAGVGFSAPEVESGLAPSP
ncbi:MAG: hypothetical protein RL522_2973 [Pseudomonadota bacterium]|jgi:hypothetical protein